LKYMRFGAAVPKMRSHEISCAFDKRIRELGGDIWYNTTATGITLKDGAVAGVHTDAGDVECSCVLCDCSPHSVYGALVDPSAVTSEIRKRLAAREFGTRGLVLYLGLNKTAEEIGLQEYGYFCYDSGDSAELAEKSRTIFNNGTQATVCLNRANPDCSPKGTCILSITTFYAQDVWGRISPRRYFEIKKGIAEKLVKDFERMTKLSITPYIEEIELATPVTLARYTGNPEGVMYGYAGNDWDNMLARMQMLSEDSRVEIPGISFVGGYGARTSGYSSTYICGNMEAKRAFAALKEEGKI
ncbi:MAG: NAD(P)/FAD-dependent oxidoreductase, partial [Oscillospiraceae bacterium]